MENQLADLGWPEATIFDMSFVDGTLNFKMHDILAYDNPLKYEVVEIEISSIHTLHIELTPHKNGEYETPESVVVIGSAVEDAAGFEGIMINNPFSKSNAEFYWVSCDVVAENVLINRTGIFAYKPMG